MEIPSLYPNKDKLILDVNVLEDPSEVELPAMISQLDKRQFKFPVKSIGLKADEHLFAIKGKMRPAIVIAEGPTRWATNTSEQLIICVPLYTVDKPKIHREFVINVQAFQYPSKFYIPPFPMFHIEESIARFELIQIAHAFAVKIFPAKTNPAMLSDEFFSLFRIWLVSYLGGTIDEEEIEILKLYGNDILNEAKRQGVAI
ncbi:MAG: hypothetical protein HZB59_04635 [Ignavibacteriales bacterium]|nr:hypothetical protein [Ignavibacteriales bacterium]